MNLLKKISSVPLFSVFNLPVSPAQIPSFVFHDANADEFEILLSFLSVNGYRTLDINEYCAYISGKKVDRVKKVILTFDDGLRSIWSTVFPLLKKFDMKAVYYINPGVISNNTELGFSLEDVWAKRINIETLEQVDNNQKYINWNQAREMEDSGLVNIESHSWEHKWCFVDSDIVDFQFPDQSGKPTYRWLHTAIDEKPDTIIWGAPVYRYDTRMIAQRFFDDIGLRNFCIEYVSVSGGKDFFLKTTWRAEIFKAVEHYKESHILNTRFENYIEQELAIKESLERAKTEIERRLNKSCEHFAFPWNLSSRLSVLWLKELGFKSAFRYLNNFKFPKSGDDLFVLCRVEGYWITSLPGNGRCSSWNKLGRRVLRTYS